MTRLAPGAIIAERYRLQRELGRGAYGAVFAAVRIDSEAPVALKVMHERLGPDSVGARRFEREAQVLRDLRHPNIVQLLDFGTTPDDMPFIAFELLAGRTVRDWLDTRGPLPAAECARVARQILSALGSAHAHDIVHRDIKPANVFLCDTPPGLVKVLDFGIAKATTAEAHTALTGTGQMIGTPRYMPPEQVRGEPVDARTDIYAVGAVLAEMVTGAPLVSGDSQIEIFVNQMSDEPHTLTPGIRTSTLAPVIEKAVSKAPEERFQSAHQMSVALDAVAPSGREPHAIPPTAVLSVSQPPPAPTPPARTIPERPAPPAAPVQAAPAGARRHLLLFGLAGVALLGTGIAVGSMLSRGAGTAKSSARSKSKGKKRRKKKKKRGEEQAASPNSPASKGGAAKPEIDPARVRALLIRDGWTIDNEVTRQPTPDMALSSFSIIKPPYNAGQVMVMWSPHDRVVEGFQTQDVGPHGAKVVQGQTAVVVILPNDDAPGVASRVMALRTEDP